jgi:hypothetical protein
MKTTLLALGLLTATPILAQTLPAPGQEATQPFKKANTILVYTADSAKTAIKRAAMALQQQGFAVDRVDYDLLSISTKDHAFLNSFYNMTVLVIWENNHLRYTGQWRGQAMGATVQEPAAQTNPASKKAFAEMERAALAYPGGRAAYLQRP